MQPIGQTIYLWRAVKGITQGELARDSGVSRPNLSAIEQGGRDLTVQTLRRIAAALRVSAGTLVDGVGPKPKFAPVNLNRYSLDRVARLAAGHWVRATGRERKIAFGLASVMKSKTRRAAVKQKRLRTGRSESKTLLRLKSELGPELLKHLIRRVEKNLAQDLISHE